MSESLGIVLVWPSGVQSRARIEVDPDEPLLRVIYFAGCFFEETPEDVEGWPVYVYARVGEDWVDREVVVAESA
jgi:hypothetical protein